MSISPLTPQKALNASADASESLIWSMVVSSVTFFLAADLAFFQPGAAGGCGVVSSSGGADGGGLDFSLSLAIASDCVFVLFTALIAVSSLALVSFTVCC